MALDGVYRVRTGRGGVREDFEARWRAAPLFALPSITAGAPAAILALIGGPRPMPGTGLELRDGRPGADGTSAARPESGTCRFCWRAAAKQAPGRDMPAGIDTMQKSSADDQRGHRDLRGEMIQESERVVGSAPLLAVAGERRTVARIPCPAGAFTPRKNEFRNHWGGGVSRGRHQTCRDQAGLRGQGPRARAARQSGSGSIRMVCRKAAASGCSGTAPRVL